MMLQGTTKVACPLGTFELCAKCKVLMEHVVPNSILLADLLPGYSVLDLAGNLQYDVSVREI